jgi:glycerophosphoryl diester phosphodiesterase
VKNLLEIAQPFITHLAVSILIPVIIWLRNYLVRDLLKISRLILSTALRKKYVLIWNDDDVALSSKIGRILKKHFSRCIFKSLKSPEQVLNYNLRPTLVKAVILIDSDVTKLSENVTRRNKIQRALVKYLERGGGIVATHDTIYRRTRNDELERVFGCQLTDFARSDKPIVYCRNSQVKNHIMYKDLPDTFELEHLMLSLCSTMLMIFLSLW